ncbi:MAG TPA: hypothetical protein VJA21_32515 [Verrucomicrobiae bacterium]
MLATEELIAEAAQSQRLADDLPRHARRLPLYRAVGADRIEGDSGHGADKLRFFPFITKEDIRRDFPGNFLGPEADVEAMVEQGMIELEQTSGTSEPRTPLLLPRGWWAEQERRALRLNPLVAGMLAQTPEPRRVTISSPVCSGEICFTSVPSHSERILGNTLYVSLSRYPFLWSESDLARMAAEAVEWHPELLDVDPVYGVVFARYCERLGVRLPSLRFIICSYEFLSVVHRRILQRVFQVPVFNLYGSTETGHLLMEDDQGRMRPSLETAHLEVLDFDTPQVPAAEVKPARPVGELVVTTLTNEFMPLVRYRIGDFVERHVEPFRTRYVVHGRAADAFVTANGRRVTTWQVDQCFAGLSGIAHYQLMERADGPWRLRFVPDRAGPVPEEISNLRGRLQDTLALNTPLTVEPTDTLLAENSGKFRLGYPARGVSSA